MLGSEDPNGEHRSPDGDTLVTGRDGEPERIRRWRFDVARAQGFDEETAAAIADDASVDLHLIGALLAAGCPLELARRVA